MIKRNIKRALWIEERLHWTKRGKILREKKGKKKDVTNDIWENFKLIAESNLLKLLEKVQSHQHSPLMQ